MEREDQDIEGLLALVNGMRHAAADAAAVAVVAVVAAVGHF